MQTRRLGRTGWDVSAIGFGAWGIGRTWWGKTDDATSREALCAAWGAGITFYDTAYVYGDGHSETLIGEALDNRPAVIATKIPPKNHIWPAKPAVPLSDAYPADWIIACTERSLKKLKRETIDLTQFHTWTDAWLTDERWKRAVETLKASGKIRAFGVSINDHEPSSALKLVASGLVDTVQVIFNIFDQSPAERLLPLCERHGVGVIARVPFDEGGLTGKFTADTVFEKGDFRGSYFKGHKLRDTVERADRLKRFLNDETPALPALALKFILAHPAVSTVIPGMRRASHVRENAAVLGQPPLPVETVQALRAHAWPRNFYALWDD